MAHAEQILKIKSQPARRGRGLSPRLPAFLPLLLALRNMRVRWQRTALTCLGIVLGVAVILAISIANDSTLQSLRSVFDEASGKSSLLVRSSSADGTGFDGDAVARVQGVESVVAAPSVQVRTLLAEDAQSWQIRFGIGGQASGNSLLLFGVDPEIDPQVREYDLTAGRWIKDGKYEVVMPEDYAADAELEVGDDLLLLTPGRPERLRIVGLIAPTGAALLNDGTVAFAPLTVVQDLFERGEQVDELDVVVDPDVANSPDKLEALKARLADRLGSDYEVAYPASRGTLVTEMLSTYQQGLAFFSIVAIFVGAFLIYNAFSMTVLERTREIGLLRAMGMLRRQVLGLVLAEAAILAVIGGALGVAFGMLLARGLIVMLGGVVASNIGQVSVPLGGLLQSLAVGGAVTLGSALLPARQASRISPLEALRVQGQQRGQARPALWVAGLILMVAAWSAIYVIPWPDEFAFNAATQAMLLLLLGATLIVPLVVNPAERLVRPATRAIFGREGILGSANVRRAPGRTSLTVASLMVGLSMVIANSSLAAAFIHDITSWVETALGGDLYVRAPLPMREQFERNLAALPGVAGVTKIRYFSAKVASSAIPPEAAGDDTIIFAAIDPATYRQVGEFEFAAGQGDPNVNWARFRQGDALFVSTVVADRYHLQQGGTLRLVTRRGEHDFYVAGVAVDFTGQGYIVSGSWNDMKRWFSQTGVDRFTIKLADGYTTDEVTKTIEDRYKASRGISVESTQEFKAQVLSLSQQSFALFDVIGLIGIVVAALGVINTLMMNVLERRREIGGLRSLGLTRRQTVKMILAEAATLGAIGGVFGLGFGYVLSQVFVQALNVLAGYQIAYLFDAGSFAVGAAIALGVSQVAAAYPAWRAAGVNIVEAIKHE
jgi:putative ABC transport system permease protein